MINAREQIVSELETVCDNVKMSRPDGKVSLPLVCYSMQEDTPLNIAYDRLRWRVACYESNFEGLINLVTQVDAVMTRLGYTKISETPDGECRVDTNLYLKRLDYSALVNKEHLTVVKGSR